jgi:hypothetical protein
LVSGSVKLGGATTFLVNFAGELIKRKIPAEISSLEKENSRVTDFQQWNVPVLCLDEQRLIFEDRLKIILENLARFGPTTATS